MEDIARRAGLSKGTVYLYFPAKEALFEALIEELAAPNVNLIEKLAASSPSLELAIRGLAVLAPQVIRSSDMPRLMKVLIGDSHNFPELIRRYRQQRVDRLLCILKTLLDNAVERGEIVPVDTALATRLIMAPIVMSAIWHAVFALNDDEAQVDLERLFQMHADFLLDALTKRP